jgi:dihydrofolate reductase
MGSASLVRALLAADLVDELAVMIEPIVLGGGKSIFPDDGEARAFEPHGGQDGEHGGAGPPLAARPVTVHAGQAGLRVAALGQLTRASEAARAAASSDDRGGR